MSASAQIVKAIGKSITTNCIQSQCPLSAIQHPCDLHVAVDQGKVFQVVEDTDDDYTALLLRIGNDGEKVMLVFIYNEFLDTRVFEGDDVRCYGLFAGLYSYENLFDMTRTAPMMYADKIYILNEE